MSNSETTPPANQQSVKKIDDPRKIIGLLTLIVILDLLLAFVLKLPITRGVILLSVLASPLVVGRALYQYRNLKLAQAYKITMLLMAV